MCWQQRVPEEEEERKGSKTSQRHGRAGQEASCALLVSFAMMGYVGSLWDGLC